MFICTKNSTDCINILCTYNKKSYESRTVLLSAFFFPNKTKEFFRMSFFTSPNTLKFLLNISDTGYRTIMCMYCYNMWTYLLVYHFIVKNTYTTPFYPLISLLCCSSHLPPRSGSVLGGLADSRAPSTCSSPRSSQEAFGSLPREERAQNRPN